MGSSWDSSRSSGKHKAVSCIRINWTPGDWATFCRTWGTILNGRKVYTGGPSRGPRALTWRPWTWPWGPDTAMQTWWVVCWRTSQTSRPVVCPTGQILVVDAPWPSSTLCSVSGRQWTGNLPGCCGREPKLSPCDRTISAGATSSAWVCKIVCLPRSWREPLSRRCCTSSEPLGTSDEEGRLSQHWWRPASPERWCATIFEMLTTVPVSTVSRATGLQSVFWGMELHRIIHGVVSSLSCSCRLTFLLLFQRFVQRLPSFRKPVFADFTWRFLGTKCQAIIEATLLTSAVIVATSSEVGAAREL